MGPGYVVAVLLEVAGLSGIVVAAFAMRTERKARVAELRSFLLSGQTSVAVPTPVAQNRWFSPTPRVVNVPVATQQRRDGRPQETAARSALGRAFARHGSTEMGGMVAASISAG
jgi:hypothetical protein